MQVKEVIHNIEFLPKLHAKNDLSYIKKVLAVLGQPQNKIKTIHVTGTNGKGSTSYYLSNLLKKAGQKTGLFVSPYIEKFNERIQLNGHLISDKDLIAGYQAVNEAIEAIRKEEPDFNLVTFEFETALAFWYFAQKKVDYAVIEVGIGAAHDKTNVIKPQVSIITTIGLDHEKIIGPTIEDIAIEKSGIIKSKRPVVVGNVRKNLLPILESKAKKEDSDLFLLGRDFRTEIRADKLIYEDSNKTLEFDKRSEVENYDIAIAVFAFKLLELNVSKKTIEDAINTTKIVGRYEVVQNKPKIIFDGAHNIQAMKHLLQDVRNETQGKIIVLIGMMKDKDLKEVFDLFKNEKLVLTRIDYPRAAQLEDFPADIVKKSMYDKNYKHAFDSIVSNLDKQDTLLVTGSFYLVGALLNYWSENYEN